MSRRPSAGVPATLGIRRKSVTPLTAQQALAKKELKNFEKHSVNDAKKWIYFLKKSMEGSENWSGNSVSKV